MSTQSPVGRPDMASSGPLWQTDRRQHFRLFRRDHTRYRSQAPACDLMKIWPGIRPNSKPHSGCPIFVGFSEPEKDTWLAKCHHELEIYGISWSRYMSALEISSRIEFEIW